MVRTLQPVLEALDPEVEEAAASLGAGAARRRCGAWCCPRSRRRWLTGFALAFARALGEYGSVVFIAGNMPMKTEIAPLLIMTKLEQYDYAGATAIAVAMLVRLVRDPARDQPAAGLERAAHGGGLAMTRPTTEPLAVRARADRRGAGASWRCSWWCRWLLVFEQALREGRRRLPRRDPRARGARARCA